MAIGRRLREIRLSKRMTQDELSRVSGVKQSTISALENEKNTPTTPTLELLASGLKCTISDLIGDSEYITDGVSLSPQEKKLLSDFRLLNRQGREYVLQSMAMAVRIYISGQSNDIPELESEAN